MDLRAEIRRQAELISSLRELNAALEAELVKANELIDEQHLRYQELYGVPEDCMMIPLSDDDIELLRGVGRGEIEYELD